jgi:hypothetical protein
MATINIYDFSDKLNDDRALREQFISRYVQHLVLNMDSEDIIKDWASTLCDNLLNECKQNGADGLVEQVAIEYPGLLENAFGVDTSLVA